MPLVPLLLVLGRGQILLTRYDDDPMAGHVKGLRQIISSGDVATCPRRVTSQETNLSLRRSVP